MNVLDGAIKHIYFLLWKTERISKYKEHIEKVNYDGIKFPVELKDISNLMYFVFQNKHLIFFHATILKRFVTKLVIYSCLKKMIRATMFG